MDIRIDLTGEHEDEPIGLSHDEPVIPGQWVLRLPGGLLIDLTDDQIRNLYDDLHQSFGED